MTIHSAKGLEFRNVIITGLEEELFPSAMSLDNPLSIEEERRLLYVAITRAEENCLLTYAQTRFLYGKTVTCRPSRFIQDLDKRFVDMPASVAASATAHSAPMGNSWGRERTSHSQLSFDTPRRPFKAPEPPTQLKPVEGSRRIVNNDAPADLRDSVISQAGTLRQGSRIRHERFGVGTIEAIEGTGDNCKISVAFDNVGRKQLLLKFAKFSIL